MAKRRRKGTSTDHFVAARVRERRVMVGMSQHQLGEILGVTYQQAQKYENGIDRLTAGQLYAVACALNTPITHFYEDFGEEPKSLAPLARSRLLDFARHFVEIQNEAHRAALLKLVRTLAGR